MSSNLVLCTLENLTEIMYEKSTVHGTLTLSLVGKIFYIHWTKLNGTKEQNITAVFDHDKYFEDDNWLPGDDFSIETSQIKFISFFEKPEIHFLISIDGNMQPREFVVDPDEQISFIFFIQQLVGNGICVPSLDSYSNDGSRYNLQFFENSYYGTFSTHPTHIRMSKKEFKDLEELWDRMLEYLSKLIVYLNKCGKCSIDKHYLINVASRTIHSRLIEKINEYVDKEISGKYEDITKENINSVFDVEGRIKEPEEFMKRLFHANTDPEVLPRLIPFIVGLYKCSSTEEDRAEQNKKMEDEFRMLKEQVDLLKEEQIATNEKIKTYFRVIENDVKRTDRNLMAFDSDDSIGLVILRICLRMFTLYNPPIGYLQGMNDLLVPFITTFLPNWTKEGIPIDPKTNEPLDYEKILPLIFWCFESMLNNTGHSNVLKNVTTQSPEIAKEVMLILTKISPLCAVWLKENNLDKLLWCYSDFVLIFKRSYENIWPIWIQFNVAPDPSKFLVLFLSATIIAGFDQLAKLKEISITIMMDNFHKIVDTLDPKNIGEIALYVYNSYYLPQKNAKREENDEDFEVSFDLFNPTWRNE